MSSAWYRTGTISTTSGSASVSGVGTFWATTAVKPMAGDIFTADMQTIYEIIEVVSDGVIKLDRSFVGTLSGVSYAIIRNTSATVNTRIATQVSQVLEELGDKITVSTTAPSAAQGRDGDLWIVVAE